MTESIISSKFLAQLDEFGIHTESVQRNMSVEKLVELSIQKNEGIITHSGSLSVKTGKYTGRSPQDRYIIYDDETHKTIDWGNVNRQFPTEKFNKIFETVKHRTSANLVYFNNTITSYIFHSYFFILIFYSIMIYKFIRKN